MYFIKLFSIKIQRTQLGKKFTQTPRRIQRDNLIGNTVAAKKGQRRIKPRRMPQLELPMIVGQAFDVYTTASVQNRGISFHLFHDNCPHPVSRCEQIRKCDLHSTKKFRLRNVSKTLVSGECKLKLQECNGDDCNDDDEDGNGGNA